MAACVCCWRGLVNSVEHSVSIVFYYVCMYLFALIVCGNCVIVFSEFAWFVLGCIIRMLQFAMVGISLCVCLIVVVGIWMLVLSVYCSAGLVAVVCFFLVACLLFLLFLFCW